jgi:hypothetical protein
VRDGEDLAKRRSLTSQCIYSSKTAQILDETEVIVMGSEPFNWEAALADIDARIAKLQATREGILEMMGNTGTSPSGGPGVGKVAPDAFLKMSIPEAAKKHLAATRQKQSTQAIIDALESGGLPPSKYSTMYAILRRREKQVGDIINMKGDWALQEWYPNHRKRGKPEEGDAKDEAEVIRRYPREATDTSKKTA